MAKAQAQQQVEEAPAVASVLRRDVDPEKDARAFFNDWTMLALPTVLMRRLAEEAARRNLTAPQLFQRALLEYLERTDPSKPKE